MFSFLFKLLKEKFANKLHKVKVKKEQLTVPKLLPRPPQPLQQVQMFSSHDFKVPKTKPTESLYVSGVEPMWGIEKRYVGVLASQSPTVCARLFEIGSELTQTEDEDYLHVLEKKISCYTTGEAPPLAKKKFTGEVSVTGEKER